MAVFLNGVAGVIVVLAVVLGIKDESAHVLTLPLSFLVNNVLNLEIPSKRKNVRK